MSKKFDNELLKLKEIINEMTVITRTMIKDTISGLIHQNKNYCLDIEKLEETINKYEMESDDLGWKIIALHQPMGSDLRFVLATRKINSALERIADEVINIYKKLDYLIGTNSDEIQKYSKEILHMTELVVDALSSAVETLFNGDVKLARTICANDTLIDKMRDELYDKLITLLQTKYNNAKTIVLLLLVIKSLERIGDMATDIAEDAIYYHEGKDIRHHSESDEEFKKNSIQRNKK